jgi:hypothetical protein
LAARLISDCLAGDAVLIAPVSKQIPWYQGILQGILLFWGSKAGFRCKKPLSCSDFSGDSTKAQACYDAQKLAYDTLGEAPQRRMEMTGFRDAHGHPPGQGLGFAAISVPDDVIKWIFSRRACRLASYAFGSRSL